ncbi:MAG: hypothetical protein H6855_00845 [Rhodospirillales bacterium]|nr:hypothetical protein [Rhodospirillales bacterium]MCB9964616.1 hypothetical protein [Rhodospirillales bacterium]MCB9979905.1 hypothetical protein [Rhodospirillales bacterium]
MMIDFLNGAGQGTTLGQLTTKSRADASGPAGARGLDKAQQRLADQISISDSTRQSLETLKNLDKQLTRFLDVLKGKKSAGSVLRQLDLEKGYISATSSKSVLSSTQIRSVQETVSLSTDLAEDGTLDLVLTHTRDSLSTNSFSLSTRQSSLFASF